MFTDSSIRAVIIDHDARFRTALASALRKTRGAAIVGAAADRYELRQQILRAHPEVILVDVELESCDALRLLDELNEVYPVAVYALTSDPSESGRAVQALAHGALEVFTKPPIDAPGQLSAFARQLAQHLWATARQSRPARTPPAWLTGRATPFETAGLDPSAYVVVVGASTGGTQALQTLLAAMPASFPPVAIVQHMPATFTAPFAARLNSHSALTVSEGRTGQILQPGHAAVARGDTHMVLRPAKKGWRLHYTHQRPVNRHCPSVDVLFESAAEHAGPAAVGILMTGMGADGAVGLLRMRKRGALTLCQDRDSCVVYGMPKEAVAIGAAEYTAAPAQLPEVVVRGLELRQYTAATS